MQHKEQTLQSRVIQTKEKIKNRLLHTFFF